jgi:hypothetical protein
MIKVKLPDFREVNLLKEVQARLKNIYLTEK